MVEGGVLADRFVIERLAGRGGMGEVYRAKDRETGEAVAVKFLHGNRSGDGARFEREARILSTIDDPRVVRHVAHGATAAGQPWLVMEWLDGEDLAARLRRGQLGVSEAVSLCADVAEALGALHERGIVHRDLKPSNVFLVGGRADRAKVLDFGIAQIDASTRMTGTGALLGTAGYMAPEQAKGAKRIDARADVFALGCLLFECIAGEPVFQGDHAMALLTKILFEETPRLRDRCAMVPPELGELVERFLAKDPAHRPTDGRVAAEALRGLGEMPAKVLERTHEFVHSSALTDSEQRALAVILVSAPAANDGVVVEHGPDVWLATEAAAHGATFERLLDGSVALLLSSTQVATDLAAHAASCALSLGRRAAGRRIVLAMGRSQVTGKLPMGPAIDRAARLLGAERTGQTDFGSGVVLDDAAVGLLEARFDVREESGVYVLVGERDVAEVRTLLGKPTPCVGRERELRALENLFDACTGEGGGAQVALVTGPPGVGKSRLGREILQKVRGRGERLSVWTARGETLRAGSAFGLLSGLVQSAAGLRGGEPLEVRREKLGARVAEHVPERDRRRVTEFLGELVGAQFPDDDSLPLRAARRDAQLMNDQVRAAFHDFLAAECGATPVLLLLEDLHWGDAPTVQVLDKALAELEDKPLFVLALARPEVNEVFPGLWGSRLVQEIRMRELPRKAAERLVRHVLGDRADGELIERIIGLSEGNAFYLEELIRAAAEGRQSDFPETLVAMVQSRLGALSDEERRILRAASVFGETFWANGVAMLVGEGMNIEGRIDALVDKEICQRREQSKFEGEREYAFRHALLREGAYGLLTDADRALGHKLAGEWLERRGEEDPLVLAEHFEKGGDSEKAGRCYLRGAEQAGVAAATNAAISYVRRGLLCTRANELRVSLLGLSCEVHFYDVSNVASGVSDAEELLQLAPWGSAPWAQAMSILVAHAMQSGKLDRFASLVQEVLTAEPSIESAAPISLALIIGSCVFDLVGMSVEAEALTTRMEAIGQMVGDAVPTSLFFARMARGMRAAPHEHPWSGLIRAKEALALGEAMNAYRLREGARILLGVTFWFLGANDEAERQFAATECSDQEFGFGSCWRPFSRIWIHASAGRLDAARKQASDFISVSNARPMPLDVGLGRWALAEVLRRAGDLDAADTEIQPALSMLRMVCPLDVPGALATLAELRLAQGKPDEALAAAEEGMALYASMGACSQFFRGAFLRLTHVEALFATGNPEAAKENLEKARTWLFSVAEKIGDDAYRKSFLGNVPENRKILELSREWLREEA